MAANLDKGGADLRVAIEDLEYSALMFSGTAELTTGFRSPETESSILQTQEDLLTAIAQELEVAEVLIAAGIATDEVTAAGGADSLLGSVNRLEESLEAERLAGPTHLGFKAEGEPADRNGDPALLKQSAVDAIDGVVDGALAVLEDSWSRMKDLPSKAISSVVHEIGELIGDVPQIGRLVRIGLQAVKRALLAAAELVPADLRDHARALAGTWWTERGASAQATIVTRLLSAAAARAATDKIVTSPLDAPKIDHATQLIDELVSRYARVISTLRRIIRALAAAVAIAALLSFLPVVAAWLPFAAASGYVLLAGSVIVIARDYLDTGGVVSRVDGIQRILTSAAPA